MISSKKTILIPALLTIFTHTYLAASEKDHIKSQRDTLRDQIISRRSPALEDIDNVCGLSFIFSPIPIAIGLKNILVRGKNINRPGLLIAAGVIMATPLITRMFMIEKEISKNIQLSE